MSGLDPNRSAAPAEAALLREQLALDAVAQQDMQQRVSRAKTELHDALHALRVAQEAADSAQFIHDDVTAAQIALGSRVDRARGLLHPIRRLPDDVLSMIFISWCDGSYDEANVACLAAAVCARWRRVALELPSIWRVINVDLNPVTQETAGLWTDYITTFLERSGTFPVEFTLTGPNNVREEPPLPDFWSAVKMAFAKSRSIDLNLYGDQPNARVVPCFYQRAPYLKKFSLSYEDDEDTGTRWTFFESAPLLRDFYWHGPRLYWIPGSITFQSLRNVEIGTIPLDAQGFAELLELMPNIRFLYAVTLHFSAENTPATFSVNHSALERLCLHVEDFDADVVPKMHFPCLTQAAFDTFIGAIGTDATTAILRHMMPDVQSLSLRLTLGHRLYPQQPTLRLTLELEYEYDDAAEEFFEQLAQPDTGGTWLCPQLRELGLPSPIPRASIRESILRLARARGHRAPADSHPPAQLRSVSFHPRLGSSADDVLFAAELKAALAKP
ncbi:hypothetical protein AURDEDRAFT_186069 [Auricularia subglabra TFB-10046 SS5]|nr:hypothetical protein AURDEDRAFT_186069 [Auricularia subglabra TFB-10046 SS5]